MVSLDISRVAAGSASSDLALAITMVCATAFLDAQRMQRTPAGTGRRRGGAEDDPRQRRGVAGLPIAGLGEYYQAAFKLGRQTGVQHWMVLHRLSDLDAAGDAGTRQQALAKGLLAETGTVIIHRQHPEEATRATPILGLSRDRDRSASPTTRRASRCGASADAPTRSATSAQSASETLTATDAAMADREPQHVPAQPREDGWTPRREPAPHTPRSHVLSWPARRDRALAPGGRSALLAASRAADRTSGARPTQPAAARFASRGDLVGPARARPADRVASRSGSTSAQ